MIISLASVSNQIFMCIQMNVYRYIFRYLLKCFTLPINPQTAPLTKEA
jgi:hypothetical protein